MLIPGPQSKATESEIWCSYAGKWNLNSEMLAMGSRQAGFLEVLQKILMPIIACVSLLWTQRQKLMIRNLWRETKKERGRELPGDEHFMGALTGKSPLSFSFPLNRYLLRIQLVPLGTEQSIAYSPGGETLCFFCVLKLKKKKNIYIYIYSSSHSWISIQLYCGFRKLEGLDWWWFKVSEMLAEPSCREWAEREWLSHPDHRS